MGRKNKETDNEIKVDKFYDLIIIGGGIAAINAAKRAKNNGVSPVIVTDRPLGETYYSKETIPNNAFIKESRATSSKNKILSKIKDEMFESKKNFEINELEELDIKIIEGKASFVGNNAIKLNSKGSNLTLGAKQFIIATEAQPHIPTIKGLDNIDYFTYLNLWTIEKLPKSIIILGAGIFGLEIAEAMANCGVKTTIVSTGFLPFSEPELSTKLYETVFKDKIDTFENEITVVKEKDGIISATLDDATVLEAEMLLIATGKIGNIEDLNLNLTDISYENDSISVDEYLRTTQKNVHAAGGCIEYRSTYQIEKKDGDLSAINSSYAFASQKMNLFYSWSVNTSIPLAQVGVLEEAAKDIYKNQVDVFLIDLSKYPYAKLQNDKDRFLKILLYRNKVVGASIFGKNAIELIGMLSFAVEHNLHLVELSKLTPPGLGYLDDLFQALSDAAYSKYEDSFNAKLSSWASGSRFIRLLGKIIRR